jgi:uncharacterized protein YigE (DUF2233 family)
VSRWLSTTIVLATLVAAPAHAQEAAQEAAQEEAQPPRGEIRRRQGEAVDTWTEPNPGVRHLHRMLRDPPVDIHAAVVDTARPGVRLIATPQPERWRTVSDFARAHEAAVAVNGGFWSMWQRPTGVTAGGGALWRGSEPDPEFGHFGIRDDGRAVVYGPGQGESPGAVRRLTDAVSGRPLLVTRGAPAREVLDAFPHSNQRQPRTAVGVSRDGRTVIFVVADGRQSHSRGLTLYQLARLLVELGADRAINLDGGGSSTMYIAEEGGVVTSPSPGRWVRALGLDETETRRVRTRQGEQEVYVRGVEREVMNHLAVLAPPPPAPVAEAVAPAQAGAEPAPSAPPRVADVPIATFVAAGAEPMRLGRMRELLYPALGAGLPLGALGVMLWVWRMRRARARANVGAGLRA